MSDSPWAQSIGSGGEVAAAPPARVLGSSWWVLGFVCLQIVCQVALLFFGGTALRAPLRIAVFGVSLVMLVLLLPKTRTHPASPWAIASLVVLVLGLFHPDRNTLIAGLAQIAIYAAILAPLWWVSGVRVDGRTLRAVLITLWLFYTASACTGVLQTLFPGRFQPTLSSVVESKGDALVEGYKITLASGAQIFRPMGLTDMPGGAATAGLYAFILGLGMLLNERNWSWKIACFAGMLAGLYCILLSQVRSIMVMVAICAIMLVIVLAWRRDWVRFYAASSILFAAIVVGAAAALVVGGEAVVNRLLTLVEDDPATVYYYGRGYYLHYMLAEQIFEYPVGAGLGRWGMINYYFGEDDPLRQSLWAEIQWIAWLYDGGIPLILMYGTAVATALLAAWKIAMRDAGMIGLWGAVLFAYNVGALAVTFNYPIFVSQGGMEFWLLNACLVAAWRHDSVARGGAPLHAGSLA